MSFYGVTDLTTYVIGAIGIILLPGPNSLYVLSVATAQGVKRGYKAALGVFAGDSVLLLLVALGAAGLLHTYPALFMVVKYAGAAYLGWVGLNLIRAAYQRWTGKLAAVNKAQQNDFDSPLDDGRSAPASLSDAAKEDPFKKALIISLLNPKAILFLLSFFIQFIDKDYSAPAVPFLILSALLMFFSGVYLSVLIYAGAKLADEFRTRHKLSSALSALVGGMFIWFAAKLATSSLR